jgi:hypothetical protein
MSREQLPILTGIFHHEGMNNATLVIIPLFFCHPEAEGSGFQK